MKLPITMHSKVLRLNSKLMRIFATTLAVAVSSFPLFAASVAGSSSLVLTNWQPAMICFRNAGEFIGQDKFSQARAELGSGVTNLATPYSGMAADFAGRLDSALKTSDAKDSHRLEALIQLCMDLRACDAAQRLHSREGKDAEEGDVSAAWRLWESGDTAGALADYRRKLTDETVEMWQQYWKEQIRLIEQRPANRTNVAFTLELVREHFLKGYETKADVFSALQELTRVLPYARNPKESAAIYQQMIKELDSLGDEAGRTGWEERLLSDFKSERDACANVHLDRGLRAYDKKDYPAALALFRKIAAEYPDTTAYGDAQYTIALIIQQQQKYDEAIGEFGKLLASKVDDYTLPKDGSSQDYKCYRFRAAMGISSCYEAKWDFAKALEYTELARDRYKYMSWCASCMAEMQQNVALRIAQLKDLMKKGK